VRPPCRPAAGAATAPPPAWRAAAAPAWSAVSVVSPAGSPFFSTMTCLSTTNCMATVRRRGAHFGALHLEGHSRSAVPSVIIGNRRKAALALLVS
jgi:hypothetical protein